MMKRVVITGAMGNLGWKLCQHLMSNESIARVVGLDLHTPKPPQLAELKGQTNGSADIEFVACDLADINDRRWRDEIDQCDVVVHFAAKNPYPEASWDDANASLDMTMNIALAAVDAGCDRFVFASSNHVMGRYKDDPLAGTIGPGRLTTDLSHAVGTLWHTGDRQMDSTVYAVAKSSGERICHVLAARSQARTQFACLRIGWCQPGENQPATLSAAGTPTQTASSPSSTGDDFAVTDQWFKSMWLSNRDFVQLFEKAIFADGNTWPSGCVVVNGMSANSEMPWSLDEGRRWLDYRPLDNAYA